MKPLKIYGVIALAFILLCSSFNIADRWGFFGHRRINRLAVFTLVPEMMPLFKKNIEYLTEHSVDPDKRRYAVRDEAVRHFIDLDHWGSGSFDDLPRKYADVMVQYGDFRIQDDDSSLYLFHQKQIFTIGKTKYIGLNLNVSTDTAKAVLYHHYRYLITSLILPKLKMEDEVTLSGNEINAVLKRTIADSTKNYQWIDTFSSHGILPYYFVGEYKKLVDAFKSRAFEAILHHAADIGHYIGDAHVPLHTTSNYNGQLTNQLGLHAFWESRIPELFADKEYDYLVGKANYIKDMESFIWEVVFQSHRLVDSVLSIEKRLSNSIPSDQQYCFDERLGVTIRTQCESFAKAYQEAMKGMVEKRMREAIHAVGSVWYSAWIDAGQPNLSKMTKKGTSVSTSKSDDELDKAYHNNVIKGRPEN